MKRYNMKKLALITLITVLYFAGNTQVLDPKETARRKAENRVNQRTDDAIDKGIDKIEEGIGSIFKKKEKTKASAPKQPSSAAAQKKSTGSAPSNGDETDFSEYEGSTFVPGKDLLFFEDFSTARLGSGAGNWHLYEYDPSDEVEKPQIKSNFAGAGNWLKMPRKGFVFPNSFKSLPEQFTIEFDLYADPEKMNEMEGGFTVNFIAKDDREDFSIHWSAEPAVRLDVHPHGATQTVYIAATTEYNSNLSREDMVLFEKTFKSGWDPGAVNRVSIYRNGKQVSLYLNGKEMFNLPNGLPKKASYNLIFNTNLWGDGMYVSNIRVAGNVSNATQEMKAAGKFVTNAIYFDVNSSRIKPESWATLNNAAQAIKAAPGTILIVGHTDSDGADNANLTLSQKRAEAVKTALVKEFGIGADRLLTDGKGESQPVASNTTALGKGQNRRVEFIKQ